VLSSRFRISDSVNEFQLYSGPKVNYSEHELTLNNSLQILPHGLLFEIGINESKPELKKTDEGYHAFITSDLPTPATLEYDVFSMVFYFISRYEEWQTYEKDEHGRFGLKHSIFYKHNVNKSPIVDLSILELKERLRRVFPDVLWPKHNARIISTLDIDNLFAFKGRPLWKTLAAGTKDILRGDFKNLQTRLNVLSGLQKDPFDVYDEVPAFCENEGIPLILFFLYRNGTRYDRGIRPGSYEFFSVFSRLKKFSLSIGLHPSYYSNRKNQLEKELNFLENDLGQKVNISRQHYLIFDIRTTPMRLIRAGIHVDFSMGFSDEPGFRAGTAYPFHYFNFFNEKQEVLVFMPFCIMDGAYAIHNKKNKQDVLTEVAEMAKEIKKSGGNFISVFHERSFYNHLYPGFGNLYKEMHLQIKALFIP
jgi:hypothetical protein